MTHQQSRRAAPPRPTLLLGDLEGCYSAFEALQEDVLRLQLAQSATLVDGSRDAEAWGRLVPRCRALRETLTSVGELSDFTRQVYELSADICLLAGDLGEALKCLRQLVELIYSTLAAAQLQAAHCGGAQHAEPPGHAREPAAAAAAAEGSRQPAAADDSGGGGSSGLAALLGQPCFARWPEAAGALLLYYKCHQQAAAEGVDTIITLRRLPSALLGSKEVGLALQLVVALGAGDYVSFCRLQDQAPLMVELTAQACLGQVRQRALLTMAAAYRNIETAAVVHMLSIKGPAPARVVLATLKELADRGHRAMQVAMGNVQTSDTAETLLIFR